MLKLHVPAVVRPQSNTFIGGKMKKLSVLAIILCLFMCVNALSSCCCCCDLSSYQHLFGANGLEFTSNGDGTCYVSGIGICVDTDVVIPYNSPDGDRVTSIGNEALSYCYSLTSITIPDSVTSIGDYAFLSCYSLASITIGNSVTSIGDRAFHHCSSLTSITIPDSVTSIGYMAFSGCSSLTEINVNANNACYSSIDGNLYSKDKKTLIQYAAGKTATSFVIPNSVTSIGEGAFAGCHNLTRITIPDSVTSIGYYAFEYCYNLKSITIPDSVTSIGYYAFSNCSRLTSITIPDSVTSIGEKAFYGCSSLTSVTFENPNGWWYSDYENAESGTSLSSSDLADASVAAEYLTSSYYDYYWFRD